MELWNNYEKCEFVFEGREAIVVFADKSNRIDKWLLKTEYWNAFPSFEIQMLKRGYNLAFIKNKTRWCLDEDLDLKSRFVKHLHNVYGFAEKCILVGMSCGGMFAVKFAARYPECVSAMYIDAPVMNLLSCPAHVGTPKYNGPMFEEFYNAIGMTISELICYREHPMDKIPDLIKNRIPVALIYGDSDTIVPYHENGALLEKAYSKTDIPFLCIGKPDCEHHPHGLDDPSPIVHFILKNS